MLLFQKITNLVANSGPQVFLSQLGVVVNLKKAHWARVILCIREGDISLISRFSHLMCLFRQLYNLGQNYIFFQGLEWQGPVINKTE